MFDENGVWHQEVYSQPQDGFAGALNILNAFQSYGNYRKAQARQQQTDIANQATQGEKHGQDFSQYPEYQTDNTTLGISPETAGGVYQNIPAQQLKAFANAGTFPSQSATYTNKALTGATNAYFNNAETGAILIDRSKAITVAPFKGVKYFPINDALQKALTRVEDGSQSIEDSWKQFTDDVKALG